MNKSSTGSEIAELAQTTRKGPLEMATEDAVWLALWTVTNGRRTHALIEKRRGIVEMAPTKP